MERAFDTPVPANGYRWWYLDALSDDGLHGLTLIAFVGSVFSPYYASARRRGPTPAENHCALNVALYQRGQGRWALTERGRHQLQRSPECMVIGPSQLRWEADGLRILIDERCMPMPRRLRGEIRVTGAFREDLAFALDPAGRHVWGPIAASARVRLDLECPDVHWDGHAYLDSNAGAVPLEQDFVRWNWSRSWLPDRSTAIHYDVDRRDGGTTVLGVRIPEQGAPQDLRPGERSALPPGMIWRVARATRLAGGATRVVRTYEDTPFYTRSLLTTEVDGAPASAMHESLDLDRFRQRWVQSLLPFRMPRRAPATGHPSWSLWTSDPAKPAGREQE